MFSSSSDVNILGVYYSVYQNFHMEKGLESIMNCKCTLLYEIFVLPKLMSLNLFMTLLSKQGIDLNIKKIDKKFDKNSDRKKNS